jgi:hypothetical protein
MNAGQKHCFQAEKRQLRGSAITAAFAPAEGSYGGSLSAPRLWHFNLPSPSEDRQGSNDSSSIQAMSRFGSSPGYPYAPEKAGKQKQLKAEPHHDD